MARLALFALLLQLALSFGHVHPLSADAAARVAPAAAIADPGGANPDPDDSYCASCAILALLSGGQVASAPAVAMPVSPAAALTPNVAHRLRLAARHDSFRPRALPIS